MKNKICASIDKNHIYNCTSKIIARAGENESTELEITLADELCNCWAFLDFRKPDGSTLKTPKLDIIDNKVIYAISSALVDQDGDIEVQLVLQNEQGLIWKSSIKKYTVHGSINATDDIEVPEDFITNAQKILDDMQNTFNDLEGYSVAKKEELENVKKGLEKELTDTKDASISAINTAASSGVTSVDNAKTNAVTDITTSKNKSVTELENKQKALIAEMNSEDAAVRIENLEDAILDVYDIEETIKTFDKLSFNSAPLLVSYGHQINILKNFLLKTIKIPIKITELKAINIKIYKTTIEKGKEIFSQEITPSLLEETLEIETNMLMIKGEKYYLVVVTSDKSAILKYPAYDNSSTKPNNYFENTSNYFGHGVEIPKSQNNAIKFNGEFVINSKLDGNFINESIETLNNKFSNLNEIICKNEGFTNVNDLTTWGASSTALSIKDGIAHFSTEAATTNGNWGIETKQKIINSAKSNILKTKFKVKNLGDKIIQYYIHYRNTNGNHEYRLLHNITVYNEYVEKEIETDLNYYVVYQNMDLTKEISFIFAVDKTSNANFYVEKLDVEYYVLKDGVINSNNSLNENLNNLQNKIAQVENSITVSSNEDILKDENGKGYIMQVNNGNLVIIPKIPKNVLYIGNSLLVGFGDFGICASNPNQDYYAYINSYLNEKVEGLTPSKLNGTGFEGITDETTYNNWFVNSLLPKLSDETELVIIQLSDNINTEARRTAFINSGANRLLHYIRTNAPKARVAWVSAWYSNMNNQAAISQACNNYGATFIDISDLYGVEGNQSYIGATVTKTDGTTITVDNTGVASHPSSQGFRQIADRIIEKLFE